MMSDATSPHYFAYSDGSFDKRHGIGAIANLIFNHPRDHDTGDVAQGKQVTKIIKETSNIRTELISVLYALENVQQMLLGDTTNDDDKVVHLYTDCRTVTELPNRRARLVASGYVSKKRGTLLRNADLYRAFFSMQDKLNLILHSVKGHSPASGKNVIEQNFAHVDRASRKALRGYLLKLNL